MTGAPPLIQYWHAERPPDDVAELLAGVARLNPEMDHRLFDERTAAAFVAERFGARESAAFAACAVPAMQADYFRYAAVLALGGAYVDADFQCVAPLLPALEAAPATLFGRPGVPSMWPPDLFGSRPRVGPFRIVANSLFLFRAAGHPLLRLALDVATANVERRVSEDVAVTTGPGIFTSLYLIDRLGSLDAFREYVADGILAASADLCCEVVGDPARITAAFAEVSILPFERSRELVLEAGDALAYKATEVHWVNNRRSIFR